MSTGHFKNGVRGSESRQKPWEMRDFCLPDTSKMGCAASKVEQNLQKLRKCSTLLPSPKQCGLRLRQISEINVLPVIKVRRSD